MVAEADLFNEMEAYLGRKYGPEHVRRDNGEGPDLIVWDDHEPIFQVDVKASQPSSRTGNGKADRALGQMIRYYHEKNLPTYLVVPDDWKNDRHRGQRKGWYHQVKELLTRLGLQDHVLIFTISEITGADSPI